MLFSAPRCALFNLYIAEERQEQNTKRRKLEAEGFNPSATVNGEKIVEVKPSAALQLTSAPSAPPAAGAKPQHHALPPRPSFNSFESNANALGLGAPATDSLAMAAITGSDKDWVRNRHAIRMTNMSAAEMLKAEMMSARPVKAKNEFTNKSASPVPKQDQTPPPAPTGPPPPPVVAVETASVFMESTTTTEVNGSVQESATIVEVTASDAEMAEPSNDGTPAPDAPAPDANMSEEQDNAESSPHGTKRKADDVEAEDGEGGDEDAPFEADDDDAPADTSVLIRKVKPDGSVEQEDTVK